MSNGNNDSPRIVSGVDVFEVWKEYENIAMHFNELIIQLRVRALAGVGVISALVGFMSKGNSTQDFSWGVFSAVMIFLLFAWVAIWFLDTHYYNRLLSGSIDAVLELEKKALVNVSPDVNINMSHKIEASIKSAGFDGRKWFYGTVSTALVLALLVSVYKLCSAA